MPKNRLYIEHPEIVTFPGSELSADIAAGATTGSVLNNSDFASDNIILMGSYNQEEAELVECDGITNNDQVGFSAAKFAHAKGTNLTRVEYDQYVLERSGTEAGTFAAIETASLAVDEANNMYVDNTTWSSAWYKYRYYDSVLNTYSSYSDAFQIEYKENSLYEIKEMIRQVSGKKESDKNLDRLVNHYQRKICSQYNYPFMDTSTTDSSVANQVDYDIPSNCKQVLGIRITRGTAYHHPKVLPRSEFKLQQLNTSSALIPTYWTRYGNVIQFHNPFSDLGTNNITIYYSYFPARLDSDNDLTPLPLIDALVNRVAYGLCLASNSDKAEAILMDYQGALNELKAIYGVSQMESFPQVGFGRIEPEEIIDISTT